MRFSWTLWAVSAFRNRDFRVPNLLINLIKINNNKNKNNNNNNNNNMDDVNEGNSYV